MPLASSTSSVISGAVGDLDGDGYPDVLEGTNFGSPYLLINNRTATPFQGVTAVPVAAGDQQQQAYIADVNVDGHPDIVAVGFNSQSRIYYNNGTSTPFSGVTGVPFGQADPATAAAIADINGDGFPDIALATTNHVPTRLFLSNGGPVSTSTPSLNIGTDIGYAYGILLTDVNGDGRPDAIISWSDLGYAADPSGIAIYLHNGTSSPFDGVAPIRLLQGTSAPMVEAADLNGDGMPDLVVSGNTIFYNTGSHTAPYVADEPLVQDPHVGNCGSVGVGDVNHDGLPDIVVGCSTPHGPPPLYTIPPDAATGAIYVNNGTADPFAGVTPIDIRAEGDRFTRSVVLADLARNGTVDALLADGTPSRYVPLIVDRNPVAHADVAATTLNQFVNVDVLANDTDADGTLLRSSLSITATPLHGITRIDPSGYVVMYQPDPAFTGTDSFTYTVQDNLGVTSNVGTASITVGASPSASGGGGGGALDELTLMLLTTMAAMRAGTRFRSRDGCV